MIIGTWNLQNLFPPGSEYGPTDEATYRAKLLALADTINAAWPDVLAVQEVGDPAAVDDLVAELAGDWTVELAEPDDRGIRVGLLATRLLSDIEHIADFPRGLRPIQVDDTDTSVTSMRRPALQARVDAGGYPVDVITCHLKSKLLSFPGGRFTTSDEDERARFGVYALNQRAAEAATVRTAATRLLADDGQNRAVIVLGDMNDGPVAATTQILLGPPGSEIGTAGFAPPDNGDGQRLWNVAPLIPPEDRYTRIYRGQPELIDHILVSHLIAHTIGPGNVMIAHTAATSITDYPSAERDNPGSDHRPIFLTIDV
jgi:endonuclease/exonuclease/phosphatase family metal-dependent hydrolase